MTEEFLCDQSRFIYLFSSVIAGQGLPIAIGSTSVSLLKQAREKKRKHVGLLSYIRS